jgi:hypothetical protein
MFYQNLAHTEATSLLGLKSAQPHVFCADLWRTEPFARDRVGSLSSVFDSSLTLALGCSLHHRRDRHGDTLSA